MWFFQAEEKLKAKPLRRKPTEHMKSQRASMTEEDRGSRKKHRGEVSEA